MTVGVPSTKISIVRHYCNPELGAVYLGGFYISNMSRLNASQLANFKRN